MPKKGARSRTEPYFIRDEEHTVERDIMIGTKIGRMRFKESKPEQVYRFRWTEQGKPKDSDVNQILKVTLHRKYNETSKEIEELTLLKVVHMSDAGSKEYRIGVDVELQLCTLDDDEFWLDSGKFEVLWT
jgi:hypothetical protein